MSRFFKTTQHQGIIHIQSTRNNTIITLTDHTGATQFGSSAGRLGFRNARKSTTYAAQAVAEVVASRAASLGFSRVSVRLHGLGYGKRSALRALYNSRLDIGDIQEHTPLAHNGCRPRRTRRV